MYSGLRAKDAGLVDRVGGFEEACRYALAQAKVSAEKFDLTTYGRTEKRLSLLKLLAGAARARVYAFCPRRGT